MEEELKDQFVICTTAEVVISCITRLLSILWYKIMLGFDCNTCTLSILLVCIKTEISLRVCLIILHHSYLLVSTRH
jgi:hypothetical protein